MSDISKAIKIASKKLKFLSEKQQNENLSYCCGSFAEAYRIGAEEAQQQIIDRLRNVGIFKPAKKAPKNELSL